MTAHKLPGIVSARRSHPDSQADFRVRALPLPHYAMGLAIRIARDAGLSVAEMLSRSRERHVVAARHRFWHVLHASTELSFAAIGRMCGVDHTSVLAGVDKHGQRIARER